jgi:DNA-binding transcriptional regulator YiaG
MKLHPRERIVDAAERDIQLAIREMRKKYKLTSGEFMMIMGQLLSHYAKYEIRWERHGNMEKEGGLE